MADEVKPPESDPSSTDPSSTTAMPVPPAPSASMPPPPPAPVPAAPPGYAAVVPVWRSVRGLSTALTVLLGLSGVAALAVGVALASRLSVLNDLKNSGFTLARLQKDSDAVDLVNSLNVAFLIVCLAIFVCMIIWMFRGAQNNASLGRTQPRLGPGWAIGGWFIPLANLVIPVLVTQDLWRGSDPSVPRGDLRWKIAPRSALVGWWWGLWIVGLAFRFAAGSSSNDNATRALDDARRSTNIGMVSVAVTIAAAVLAILVVRRISQRQEECLKGQQAAWTAQQGGTAPPAT